MEHKAFLLDFRGFERELQPILREALQTNDVGPLRDFIQRHIETLRDPIEGGPLDPDWESTVELQDPDGYGDLALTRYYDPSDDRGLLTDWEQLEQDLRSAGLDGARIVLGTPIGPAHRAFDPGKMGAYFQSPELVRENLKALDHAAGMLQNAPPVAALRKLFEEAAAAGKGLYVTF